MKSLQSNKEVPREARVFASKTARSIAEIQQSVNNMADVVVFLEVLGYDEDLIRKNGFDNMHDLAKHVYDCVDVFDEKHNATSAQMVVPGTGKRIVEGLSMAYPWLGALALL